MTRGQQWSIWHVQLEAKVHLGIYTQEEADDIWIWLHDVMNSERGLAYQGA